MDYNKPPLLSKQLKQARYTISESDKRLYPGPSSSYPHKAPRMTMDGTIRKHVPTSPLPPPPAQHQQSSQQSQASHSYQQHSSQKSQASHLYQQQSSQQLHSSQQHSSAQSQTRRVTMGRKLPKAFISSPEVKLFNSGGVMPQATTKIRDTRDIRNPEFQRHAMRMIIEYLNKCQYGTVTTKMLRGLGAKDFENIFKFLFLQLTQGYEFGPRFEDEFTDLLRTTQYPYLDSISPKSLYSIAAPHSLPRYLALLSWMVESCLTVEKEREKLHKRMEQEGIIDSTKGMSAAQMDRLFLDYSVAKYNAFMKGKDGQDEYDELKAVFKAINKSNISQYNRVLIEKETVLHETKKLDEQLLAYDQKLQKVKKMEERIATYNKDISSVQNKIEKYIAANQKMEDVVNGFRAQMEQTQRNMEEIKASIKNPEVTDEEIKKLFKQQSDLDMQTDSRRQVLDKLRQTTWEMETQIQQKQNKIEYLVVDYNELTKSVNHQPLKDADIDPAPLIEPLVFNSKATTLEDMIINHQPLKDADIDPAPLIEPLVFNSKATTLEDMITPQLEKTTIPMMQHYLENLKLSLSNLRKDESLLQSEHQAQQDRLHQEQQEQRKLEGDCTKRMQQLTLERREAKDELQKYTDSKDEISRASDKLERDGMMELVQAQSKHNLTLLELDSSKMTVDNLKSNVDKKLDKIVSEIGATTSYIPSRIEETRKEFDQLFPEVLDLDIS